MLLIQMKYDLTPEDTAELKEWTKRSVVGSQQALGLVGTKVRGRGPQSQHHVAPKYLTQDLTVVLAGLPFLTYHTRASSPRRLAPRPKVKMPAGGNRKLAKRVRMAMNGREMSFEKKLRALENALRCQHDLAA